MKKWIIFILLACVPVLLFAGGKGENYGVGFPIKGNGNMVTSEIPVTRFESIHIEGRAVINYYYSQEYRAVITIDSNLEEYVNIYTQDGVLNIKTKRRRNLWSTNYTVNVYAPTLTGLSVAGSTRFDAMDKITSREFRLNVTGHAKVKGTFETKTFSARISGFAEIDGHVECDNFKSSISGFGNMELTGNAAEMDINISGSGNLELNEFKTNNADINISGSGTVHVWVVDKLKARVSGSGRVHHRGNPAVDFSGSGSARIIAE